VGRTLGVIAFALAVLAAASPASAVQPPASVPSIRALSPPPSGGYWQLRLSPGQRVSLSARVTNVGAATATFMLVPVTGATGPGTGVGYHPGGVEAAWVTGLPGSVTLSPRSSEVVHATLSVPKGVPPAQYVGGIEALAPAGSPTQHGRISISSRAAAIVAWVATVGQPQRRAIRLLGAQVAPGLTLQLSAANTGQLLFAPRVRLGVVRGSCASNDTVVVPVVRQWLTTVPSTTFTYPVPLSAPLPPGRYCAVATVAGEPTQRIAFTVTGVQRRSETEGVPPARVRVPVSQGVPIIVVIAVLTAAIAVASAGFVAGKRRRGRA
jgi:hypothetical protein